MSFFFIEETLKLDHAWRSIYMLSGVIVDAIAFEKNNGNIHIISLGSTQKGIGKILMKHVARQAEKGESAMSLKSTEEGKGFYNKIGLTPQIPQDSWNWSADKNRITKMLRDPSMLAWIRKNCKFS